MTKAEIVAQIAQKTGIEKVAIQATVEEFMNVVKESLSEGENVYLRGFGSFIIKKRAEKTRGCRWYRRSAAASRQAGHPSPHRCAASPAHPFPS